METKEYRVDIKTYNDGRPYNHFSVYVDATSEDEARNLALDECDFVGYNQAEGIVRQDY